MNEIVFTTPDQLKGIVKECLSDLNQPSQSLPKAEASTLLYSMKSLASFLGCSVVTAQKLKNSGKIRFKQFGRKFIFNTEQVTQDIRHS